MGLTEFIFKYWIEVVFGVITGIFGWMYRKLSVKLKKKTIKDEAMETALLAQLDNAMARQFERCKNKESKTHEESRLFERLFKAYCALGGNGAVADEHEQFRLIELKDE